MKLEELSRYGKPLEFPREVQGRQLRIVISAMRREFGLLGLVPFLVRVLVDQRRIRRSNPELVAEAGKIGPEVETEFVLLTALFRVAAKIRGRDAAYRFLRDIFQAVALYSMPAIYQVDKLTVCDGDAFDNFKRFNVAMFEAMNEVGTWTTESIEDQGDRLRIKVTSCANVALFSAIGCPELGKLGCDHDLAGYPVILDRVNAEFRRPCTLANGDGFCDFNFYRKGTAPPTEHLNQ